MITGAVPVAGASAEGALVALPLPAGTRAYRLFVDGAEQPLAREPDVGVFRVASRGGNDLTLDAPPPAGLEGATAWITDCSWLRARTRVTGQSGSTVTVAGGLCTLGDRAGAGVLIEGVRAAMDTGASGCRRAAACSSNRRRASTPRPRASKSSRPPTS